MNLLRPLRRTWRVFFLATTAAAVGEELFASFDHNGHTEPWTDLVVKYVPGEVTAFLIAGLAGWLAVHFGRRYANRAEYLRDEDAGR